MIGLEISVYDQLQLSMNHTKVWDDGFKSAAIVKLMNYIVIHGKQAAVNCLVLLEA